MEAERALNVAGAPSAYSRGRQSAPYPHRPVPLSYNLQVLKGWAEQSGPKFTRCRWRATCRRSTERGARCVDETSAAFCPTGARHSPDFTFGQLLERKQIVLHERTLVRKPGSTTPSDVAAARAWTRTCRGAQEYLRDCSSWHRLLLVSGLAAPVRQFTFPDGPANRSDWSAAT